MKQVSTMMMIAALAVLTGMTGTAYAEEEAQPARSGLYTLETCPVSGQKLGSMGDPVVKTYDGREVRFCCEGCVASFEEDKDAHWKKVDAAIIKQQKPLYPIETCVVMGAKLDAMGGPVDKVYRNRLVRFCCAGCVSAFEREPEKFLKKLDEAVVEKQKEDYPLETCVVSGQELGSMGEPVEYVAGGRLVRLCCKGCVNSLESDPQKYLKKLDEAKEDEAAS